MGAKIVSLKKLHESAINKIDSASSSFWNAKNGDNPSGLGLMDRQRVKMWMRDIYREIDDTDADRPRCRRLALRGRQALSLSMCTTTRAVVCSDSTKLRKSAPER